MFLILLSIYFTEVRKQSGWSAVILGLAMGIKVVAVIFAPALLFFNPTIREKLRFLLVTIVVVAISAFPYVLQNPFLILQRLSHYSGQPQVWGWSFIASAFADSSRYHWISDAFTSYGKVSLLFMLVVLSIAMNRRRAHWTLFSQCGLVAFFFIFFIPGFGVQYLAWLSPWIVVLNVSVIALYSLSAGAFLAAVYTHWCRGFPWDFANAFEVPVWSKLGLLLGLVCWFMTGIVLLLFADTWLKWRTASKKAFAN
jgi:hypothetical protein